MEFTAGCNQLGVEAYKGVVDFIMTDSLRQALGIPPQDTEITVLLSYAEWDELVKAVEEDRAKEKANA